MTRRLRVVALSAIAVISTLLASNTTAALLSGFLNDQTNPALVGSYGYGDLRAPGFADDDEIAHNVAIYRLTVGTAGTINFTSTGFSNLGAQPYFTLFAGSGIGATFVDSNGISDPFNIDFTLAESVAPGSYMFAVGVWMNLSFAENNPDPDPTLGDGFTGLGVPGFLGSTLYEIGIASNDGATFDFAPATGIITPPASVPEPTPLSLILFAPALLAHSLRRKARRDFSPMASQS